MVISKKIRIKLLTILFFFVCMQNLNIVEYGTFAIKYYHVFAILMLPLLLFKRKVVTVPLLIVGFYAIIIVISLYASNSFGINSFFFNYLFALYMVITVRNVGYDFDKEQWISLIKNTFTIVLLIVWIKNLLQIQIFIDFFKRPYGHPLVTVFFGGGVNLEASYIALMCPIFYDDKRMWIYTGSSFAISILYTSRVGILINALVALRLVFIKVDRKHWWKILSAIIVASISIFIVYRYGYLDYLIRRFTSIGNEAGSIGRLNMWQYISKAINTYPFGVGIGNSIIALERISGLFYIENNVHNLYLQMFVDLGLAGGMYYLYIIGKFAFMHVKNLRDPIIYVLAMYIIACLIQFRGAEVVIYFLIAIYLNLRETGYYRKTNRTGTGL